MEYVFLNFPLEATLYHKCLVSFLFYYNNYLKLKLEFYIFFSWSTECH